MGYRRLCTRHGFGCRQGKDHEFHFGPAKFQMLFGYLTVEVKRAFEYIVQERGLGWR